MVAGRPPKYDLDKEAEDLLEWSKKQDSTSLYQFTYHKDYLAQELTDFCKRNEKFALALKKAKECISINRENQCNAQVMNYGVWARSAAMYDKLVDNHEEDKKDRDLERKIKLIEKEIACKSQANQPVSDDIMQAHSALLHQLSVLQRAKSSNFSSDSCQGC